MSLEPTMHEFRFPDIGEGLTEGTIVELRVAPGQRVRQGEALAVVETDKVVTEIPSPFDGVVVEIPVSPGKVVRVGEIVALIRADAVPSAVAQPAAGMSAAAAPAAPVAAAPAPAAQSEHAATVVGRLDTAAGDGLLPPSTEGLEPLREAVPASSRNGGPAAEAAEAAQTAGAAAVRATPLARKIASDAGIDLAAVKGTGPGGRILRRDLPLRGTAAYGQNGGSAAPAHNGEQGTRQKLSATRTAIAVAMEKSQAIPAAAVHDWTIVDELLKLRRTLNETLKEKIGLLAFFVKAAASALRRFPLLSSIYYPEKREYETHETPHIGVAVDTEEGLVVPVVKDAGGLSLQGIQSELARLTSRARARKLTLEEIRGGTFTISNFGSFSGVFGNPMILPPQVAILGVGRIHEMAVVRDGAVAPASVLPLSLVVDHRLIDGAYACKFLARFMELVSQPAELVTT